MNEIRVSVVIPLYNGGDHIMKCIKKLDAQDCAFDYEVIIVDDCSTDDSADLVESRINELHRSEAFQLIRSFQNGRAGAARNIGVKMAKGHYILFIDQDDYPDTKMLRILWENSQEGKVDLVSCAVMDRKSIPYFRPKIDADHTLSQKERSALLKDYGYVFASLIKRSVLLNNHISFPENVMFEDCLYNVGVIASIETVQTINEILYYREDEQNSQTASFSEKKLNDRIDAVKIYLHAFQDNEKIRQYMPEIKLNAFYYTYLSCMFWILAIPNLYTQELFNRCLKEGRAMQMSWKEVIHEDKHFSKPILYLLKLIYDVPIMAFPARFCGTTGYKILKAAKKEL